MTEVPGRFFIAGMRLVPKKRLSRLVRQAAQIRSREAVKRFAARYGVAIDEAEKPLDAYSSLLEFFTRRLKPGARPIDEDPRAFISPADGVFLVAGEIGEGVLYQAKGREFTLRAMLADDEAERVFRGGSYAGVYLSPRDYHRVHAPVTGLVTGYTYIPGSLFPVNPAAVAHVDNLFARNERIITHIDSVHFGKVDVVMIGATCVGHMKVAYDAGIFTNGGEKEIRRQRYQEAIPIHRGEELGVFEMGSTVIVVVQRPLVFVPIASGQETRLGERIALAADAETRPAAGSGPR